MRKTATVKSNPAAKTSRSKQPAPLSNEPLDITTRDAEGRTPLHLAAWYGYTTVVQRMLAQEADTNARDGQERTPGHWAAFRGYLEVIKILVDAGCDVNARDAQGRTWLAMAAIGRQSTVEAFLRSHDGVV
jgi:ankyrin repeat protein